MLPVFHSDRPSDQRSIAAIETRRHELARDLEERVRAIIEDIRSGGDAAICRWTLEIEGRELGSPFDADFRNPRVTEEIRESLELAAGRIRTFHERELRAYESWKLESDGTTVGLRSRPLSRVAVYVPGGKASYPSTVLMAAIPAHVAGVSEIVVTTPNPTPEVLFAAKLCGVARVLSLGGAQAIAALALGTETVPRVDKIVGPGNLWVTCAKRLLVGEVGIDGLAGPTEVLILGDDSADARYVAADLLAQAEHDEAARPILVTTSIDLANRVREQIERQLLSLPRRAIAQVSVQAGAAIVVHTVDEALAVCDRIAPEHVEVHMQHPHEIAERIRCAGAIFIGPMTPEPCGDYLAGPSHVLPTGGTARFASPLGVADFLKRTSILSYTREALSEQAGPISRLAQVEGLEAHRRAISVRLSEENP